ncbi:MAG: zinc ABC transporter substrate-binding protein [Rikenellaceae bacterium]
MIKSVISLFSIITLLYSCQGSAKSNKDVITVTIEPLKYLTEQVVGDDFDINVIVPSGASPETYEPSPSNMRKFETSKLFISIGLMECEFDIIKNSKTKNNIAQIQLKDSINLIKGSCTAHNHSEHAHSAMDPHIWSSPRDVKTIISMIEKSASELKPQNKDRYIKNAQNFNQRVDSLDLYIKNKLSEVKQRYFIIYHPALTYYSRDYDLTQIVIENGGKESSGKHLKEIIDSGKNAKSIFYQSQFSKNSVESVCKEIGASAIEINPLAYDWLKNMYIITDSLYNSMK